MHKNCTIVHSPSSERLVAMTLRIESHYETVEVVPSDPLCGVHIALNHAPSNSEIIRE
jgi:hypothetical protein